MEGKGKRRPRSQLMEPMEPIRRKRLRSTSATEPIDVPKPKFHMDIDLLECPICTKYFTPPVYSCNKGHLTCKSCCKTLPRGCATCQAPIGSRSIHMDKILESYSVSCKNAPYGCEKMLKCIERKRHEKNCEHNPLFMCPFFGCPFDGSKFTLPAHLKEEHEVPTVELNEETREVSFRMDPDDRYVMVKGVEENTMFALHRENFKQDIGGEVFFCTSFGVKHMTYNLKVKLALNNTKAYSVSDKVVDIRGVDSCREDDFLLYPFGETDQAHAFDMTLSIHPRMGPLEEGESESTDEEEGSSEGSSSDEGEGSSEGSSSDSDKSAPK